MIVLARIILRLLADRAGLVVLWLRPRRSVEAENLVLRRQLALNQERGVKPRRVDAATRVSLAVLSRLVDWRDTLVVVATTFQLLDVLVVIEHGSRRLVRVAVTAHPSAAWTLQQLLEVVGFGRAHRYLIHDRDSIFAMNLDQSIRNLGLIVLKSPPHSPQANAICERAIGTIRRECLDWLMPLSKSHLRSILRSWVGRYTRGRPHMALGPGVRARSVLGGLHHEYLLVRALA